MPPAAQEEVDRKEKLRAEMREMHLLAQRTRAELREKELLAQVQRKEAELLQQRLREKDALAHKEAELLQQRLREKNLLVEVQHKEAELMLQRLREKDLLAQVQHKEAELLQQRKLKDFWKEAELREKNLRAELRDQEHSLLFQELRAEKMRSELLALKLAYTSREMTATARAMARPERDFLGLWAGAATGHTLIDLHRGVPWPSSVWDEVLPREAEKRRRPGVAWAFNRLAKDLDASSAPAWTVRVTPRDESHTHDAALVVRGCEYGPLSTGLLVDLVGQDEEPFPSSHHRYKLLRDCFRMCLSRGRPRESIWAVLTDLARAVVVRFSWSNENAGAWSLVLSPVFDGPDVQHAFEACLAMSPVEVGLTVDVRVPVAVERVLGTGAHATVYRLPGAPAQFLKMGETALRECAVLERLAAANVPHVPTVVQRFERANAFSAQPVGMALSKVLVSSSVLLRGALALVDCLERAWQAGLAHRDVRPDNVVVLSDAKLVLIDWSAACAVGASQFVYEGTSRFAARAVLEALASERAPPRELRHDLESLVWMVWHQQLSLDERLALFPGRLTWGHTLRDAQAAVQRSPLLQSLLPAAEAGADALRAALQRLQVVS